MAKQRGTKKSEYPARGRQLAITAPVRDAVKRAMDAAFAVGEAQADGVDPLALAGLVAEMNDAESELHRVVDQAEGVSTTRRQRDGGGK